MSSIFSLCKDINEGCGFPSGIFSNTYSNEKYIETSINTLEHVNEAVSKLTTDLYTNISEANSVKEENNAIRDFIQQIQSQFENLSIKITSSTSRFAIAANNYCDSVKQMIDNSSINIDSRMSYQGSVIEFYPTSLMDSNVPKMNPYGIFEKEFNMIAELLQELPVTASNKDKLNAVATVCNKFNGLTKRTILADTYKELFGCDCTGQEGSFISSVTSFFREKEIKERNITIKDYQDAVSCISNCDEFISCIETMNNKLMSDLRHIIFDLNDIVSGSDRNKFKVNTKQDGIKNTIYSVDVYTSNKIMWMVQEKVHQVTDVFNKYILALSVKMENILTYIKQSSDIISTFSYIDAKCVSPKVEKPPVEPSGSDTEMSNDDGSDTPMDNTQGKTPIEDNEIEEPDKGLDGEDDFLSQSTEESDEEPELDLTPSDVPDKVDEAVLEYKAALYEYNCALNKINVLEHAIYLLEEGEEDNKENAAKTKELVGKLADQKQSMWKTVIGKLVDVWKKFKEVLSTDYSKKVDYLKANEKYIAKPPFDYTINMPRINHKALDQITIPDFNYNAMKPHLDSKESFINSQPTLKPFMPSSDGESLQTKIKNSVISPTDKITNANQIKPSVIYNEYCKDFDNYLNNIKKMADIIEKGERNASTLAKTMVNKESAVNTTGIDMYFAEFSATSGDKDKKEETKKETGDISKHLSVYFGTCADVMTTKMTVCRQVFDEYNAYLKWHIEKHKNGAEANTNNDSANTNNGGGEENHSFD